MLNKEIIRLLTNTQSALKKLGKAKPPVYPGLTYHLTYEEWRINRYQFNDAEILKNTYQHLLVNACESYHDGWLGRFNPHPKINHLRQVIYYSLLNDITEKLLTQLKRNQMDDTYKQTWAEFERILTEGMYLADGHLQKGKPNESIWCIYSELFISLSKHCPPPPLRQTGFNAMQELFYKTSHWCRSVLQAFTGSKDTIRFYPDQRLQIEYYFAVAIEQQKALAERQQALATTHISHPRAADLKTSLDVMVTHQVSLFDTLKQLQKTTALADIQQLGQQASQAITQIKAEINAYDAIVTPVYRPEQAALPADGSIDALLIPTAGEIRKMIEDDCKTLNIELAENQQTLAEKVITKAYKSKARTTHPDKGGSKEQFQAVGAAYDRLKNMLEDQRQLGRALGNCTEEERRRKYEEQIEVREMRRKHNEKMAAYEREFERQHEEQKKEWEEWEKEEEEDRRQWEAHRVECEAFQRKWKAFDEEQKLRNANNQPVAEEQSQSKESNAEEPNTETESNESDDFSVPLSQNSAHFQYAADTKSFSATNAAAAADVLSSEHIKMAP